MIIAVGSQNRNKIEAVQEVIQEYDFLHAAEVIGREVSSGVSRQPRSLDETVAGAQQRARAAFVNCDYSIGLESGLIVIVNPVGRYLEHTVCALYDGRRYSLGFSAAFELPPKIVTLIFGEGYDLEQASLKVGLTANPQLGNAEGLIGILTQGKVSRKEYTKPAIRMALIGLQQPGLY